MDISDPTERDVAHRVLREASKMEDARWADLIQALEKVVQNGVAKAFGG